jgi:hypothetical protein
MALRNLLLRFAFGGFLAALSFLIARRTLPAPVTSWTEREFDRVFVAIYAASHFLLFFIAFFLLHQKPWADLVAFYVPQAHAVMQGLVPYKNFESSYAPLNPYLDALLLRLHDSPLTILAFQIACDVLSIPFWVRFLRRVMNESTVRKAALLYLVQPLVIWDICIDGKNQGLISLLLAISFWAIARREILSGISFCLSWVLVKILPVIFLPTMFIASRKRIRWLLSALVPSAIVYGSFVLQRADVLAGLRKEGSISTPQNLPYLSGLLTGINLAPKLLSLILLAGMAGALFISARAQLTATTERTRLWKTVLGTDLILLVMMLLNKKSDTSYLAMCFFLLCAFVAFEANRGKRAILMVYALLSFIGLPIVSFWYWPLQRQSAIQLHAMCLAGDRNALMMLAMQALLAVGYLGLAYGILRAMQESQFESSGQGGPMAAVTGSVS